MKKSASVYAPAGDVHTLMALAIRGEGTENL
jgi:hypothetical protein